VPEHATLSAGWSSIITVDNRICVKPANYKLEKWMMMMITTSAIEAATRRCTS
jgi:hypothetical protein